jgi:uncharacterized protein YkwD
MLTSSLSHKIKALAVVLLAVVGFHAAAGANSAQAMSIPEYAANCAAWGNVQMNKLPPAAASLALQCAINLERYRAHIPALGISKQLMQAAQGHATDSIAHPFWDKARGHVSHLNSTTPIPPASAGQQALDDLANRDSMGRIMAAGYCAGGHSYSVGEITYGGVGTGSTAKAAVRWWMSDKEHHDALLDPKWKQLGPVGLRGSAFNPPDSGATGTFVVDFGVCS